MILHDGLRIIRFTWNGEGLKRSAKIEDIERAGLDALHESYQYTLDLRFTKDSWRLVMDRPLDGDEVMSTITWAEIGDKVALPCKDGGALIFRVSEKIYFCGKLSVARNLLVGLENGMAFTPPELDVVQRLVGRDSPL
jgi:hypothetical protein